VGEGAGSWAQSVKAVKLMQSPVIKNKWFFMPLKTPLGEIGCNDYSFAPAKPETLRGFTILATALRTAVEDSLKRG
jgi:hypothetical protein